MGSRQCSAHWQKPNQKRKAGEGSNDRPTRWFDWLAEHQRRRWLDGVDREETEKGGVKRTGRDCSRARIAANPCHRRSANRYLTALGANRGAPTASYRRCRGQVRDGFRPTAAYCALVQA
ncbi:uncharacterized protein HMPREF1120_09025 [Exophiala dermatitidis NIH/UT8656]|uniref:Uncharacterized protein n=1 Tax=Exophiala dermatitidis (strain ATCC 34100 / CBS 525.76 / NIH/UT8656) TaxID=858893 RepID=H6CBE0_EXODN|nr:uncharacterized protein HMPREF1120_09025 [Exophiala dermatitidis NIH/UT8656]EHY61087.1 hypothetical protein HMPREF1120_09025 [Exophiala dermatitidis NIH/UT8656]